MGSIDRGIHNFVERLTTIPGTHARLEREDQSNEEARQANLRIREHQALLQKQKESMDREASFHREQLNRQSMRANRGRIRGGIFGDSQPGSVLSGRLGR